MPVEFPWARFIRTAPTASSQSGATKPYSSWLTALADWVYGPFALAQSSWELPINLAYELQLCYR